MTTNPTVFIVDDDPAVRDSVAALVKSKGVAAASFASAEEFLAAFESSNTAQTGCLVVDVRMIGMSGLDLQQRLAANHVSLPVIIVTGFGDIPTAVRAMQAGALTFLEKPCQAPELWQAVQTALNTCQQRMSEEQKLSEVQSRWQLLTSDERQVIRLMLAGKTNKTIAAQLDVGLRTVELRRSNIMKKMRAESFADLVRLLLSIKEAGGEANENPAGTAALD